MIRRMRGPVDGDDVFVAASQGAVDRNTDELVEGVRAAYGDAEAEGFRDLWQQHVQALEQYGDAIAADDTTGANRALDTLDGYAAEYGRFMAGAASGRLDAEQVAGGVTAHVNHLVDQAQAYARGDYAEAFRLERVAYAAMFSVGTDLAGAAVVTPSGELPAAFDAAPERLRSALGLLLGEHMELAFDATRAVVSGNPSVVAAAQVLDQNTADIAAAMRVALGAQAAKRFSELWALHIDAIVDFAVAVADRDAAAQAEARERIDRFPVGLGKLLPGVGRGRVSDSQVVGALRTHDVQLLQQVTAYAAEDFARAHDLAYDGYEHMFAIADTLASVLRGRASGVSPVGGAATGGGGRAGR